MFDQIPPTVFVAVGTVAAAVISGSIAFLNLIVSKEQAISEFRQKWIDSLREELADFLTAANSVSIHSQVMFASRESRELTIAEALEPLHEPLGKMYATYHRIMLRLNPTEHKKLSAMINTLENAMSKPNVLVEAEAFGYMCADVSKEAHAVLKKEWERVKRGERTYRIVKGISAGLMIVALIVAAAVIAQYTFSG